MDKRYIKLFSEIARTVAILAERVMEYDHSKNDTNGEHTAQIMRDDYRDLKDKIQAESFTTNQLVTGEYAKLLVGAMIIIQNIEDRITNEKKAVESYKIDILPKLQRIVNECKDDASATKLAEELFIITENTGDTNN